METALTDDMSEIIEAVKEEALVRRTIKGVLGRLGIDPNTASIEISPEIDDLTPDAVVVIDGAFYLVEYRQELSSPLTLRRLARYLIKCLRELKKKFEDYRENVVLVLYGEYKPRYIARLVKIIKKKFQTVAIYIFDILNDKIYRY